MQPMIICRLFGYSSHAAASKCHITHYSLDSAVMMRMLKYTNLLLLEFTNYNKHKKPDGTLLILSWQVWKLPPSSANNEMT